MLSFCKLEVRIKAYCGDSPDDIREFGRVIKLDKGLNIIIGDNTTGKTSLASCFYYILGMEELMSPKRNVDSLDRCLKDFFSIDDSSTGMKKIWYVDSSYVESEIMNDSGKRLLLHRGIKNDVKNANKIYISDWENGEWKNKREYFLHSMDDNNQTIDFAFYGFLANFAGIALPSVPVRNSVKESVLYLQTLFALCYIEQTRGWADYFATIKGYNILRPKQRIIEYALSLARDIDYETKQKMKEKRDCAKVKWEHEINYIKGILVCNNFEVIGLEDNIEKQQSKIESLKIAFIGKNDTDINRYLNDLEEKIGAFEQNKNAVVQDYSPGDRRLIETYQRHKQIYDDFCNKIAIDKQKLAGITLKLSELEKEHKRIVGLNKVDNVFTTLQVTVCPTCKQQLPIGEERKEEKVAKSQLEEIDHLISSKKTFLATLKEITENNLQQKQLHLLYIEKLLLQDKALVDQLSNETYFSASGISEVEIMEIAKLKLELEQTKALLNKVDTAKERLSIIKEEYEEYDKEYKSLRSNECKGLETSLSKFVVIFINYLIGFEYKSNYKGQIYLETNSESSYKYFPMVQMQNDSSELIRSVSSASDFIRSIWAYYLALLRVGCKHPGFVIFDEPCQQSMDESSLVKLFECGSGFMDKQLIFFCSSQPHTSKVKNDTHDNIIKDIIQNLPNKAMINVIEFENKAIDEI